MTFVGTIRTKYIEKVLASIVVENAKTLAPTSVETGMSTITTSALNSTIVPSIINDQDSSLKNAIVGRVTGGTIEGINISNAPIASRLMIESVGYLTNSIVTESNPIKNMIKTIFCKTFPPSSLVAKVLVPAIVAKDIESGLVQYTCHQTTQYVSTLSKQSNDLHA